MFPLWDVAIAPVLTGAHARKVVEIGALRGENTIQILDHLGPDGELHVIDPVPNFDPKEHQAQFPGRYFFHEALSVDVLPDLEAMDAALIDGDHNWWTVYQECTLLARSAVRDGKPLPVLILHDVCWPYGRRDLYYDPSNIPDEHRQPFGYKGIKPGMESLAAHGGLNPTMANALHEGGPRNGVMTGLDDFVAEYPEPLRVVTLPFYFGLSFVAAESRLAAEPDLAAALDRLEKPESLFQMLEVSESLRIRAMLSHRNALLQREAEAARSSRRYLEIVKAALGNLHYIENEARIDHLLERLKDHSAVDPLALRDPSRFETSRFNRLMRDRTNPAGPGPVAASSFFPYTAMGRARLDHLEGCLDHVRTNQVPGDLVECGTGRGGAAIFLRSYLEAHEMPNRKVWVVDEFRSSPKPETRPKLPGRGVAGFQADLNLVRDGFNRFGLLDERVSFITGADGSITDPPAEEIALVRIGQLPASEVSEVLERLYDKISAGGVVAVDERDAEVRAAVVKFHVDRSVVAPLERFDDSTVSWVKSVKDGAGTRGIAASKPGAPVLRSRPQGNLDLTVVVAFYNMRREAERTLRSLSRAYQEGIEDISYEVIAIDNGSDSDQRLTPSFVESFGPEFRLIEMGEDAKPSPVFALNRGIAEGTGNYFALMIDGAHVLTPGVFSYALGALRTREPAIVATQQWYVGPGQQGAAMDEGYDQDYEDQLFEKIRWPHAGYRLFEIGNFVGNRDWLDGVWESNCMFVSRAQLEQVGGYDQSFDEAGGGYANLELYERLGSAPDVTVCSMLGEASFHQIHGGTTTNQPDPEVRRARIFGYGERFAELRGRSFKGPGKPLELVGRLRSDAARRSKPRRLSAKLFGEVGAGEGKPDVPSPMASELSVSFTDAVWRTQPWRNTSWLGRPISSAPTDLLAYQEMVAEVRPDFIIETGASNGGRSLFFASMCDLLGHGHVLSIGADEGHDLPDHSRLTFISGSATDRATVDDIATRVGTGRGLVVLGSQEAAATTATEFELLSPLVAIGSYVVITDTIVNGHPVWPAFGPGPAEAVKQILSTNGSYVADPAMEKYSLTFNPGGFLKRVT